MQLLKFVFQYVWQRVGQEWAAYSFDYPLVLKKICEWLPLNDVKQNYSSMTTVKSVLNVSQYSQENAFIEVPFLINIVAA